MSGPWKIPLTSLCLYFCWCKFQPKARPHAEINTGQYLCCLHTSFFIKTHLSSQRSRTSLVTHGFFVGRSFPSISLAASLTAVLQVVIMVWCPCPHFPVPWVGVNFPLIVVWKVQATYGSISFSRSNLSLAGLAFSPSSDEFERLELVYVANVCFHLPLKGQTKNPVCKQCLFFSEGGGGGHEGRGGWRGWLFLHKCLF